MAWHPAGDRVPRTRSRTPSRDTGEDDSPTATARPRSALAEPLGRVCHAILGAGCCYGLHARRARLDPGSAHHGGTHLERRRKRGLMRPGARGSFATQSDSRATTAWTSSGRSCSPARRSSEGALPTTSTGRKPRPARRTRPQSQALPTVVQRKDRTDSTGCRLTGGRGGWE